MTVTIKAQGVDVFIVFGVEKSYKNLGRREVL